MCAVSCLRVLVYSMWLWARAAEQRRRQQQHTYSPQALVAHRQPCDWSYLSCQLGSLSHLLSSSLSFIAVLLFLEEPGVVLDHSTHPVTGSVLTLVARFVLFTRFFIRHRAASASFAKQASKHNGPTCLHQRRGSPPVAVGYANVCAQFTVYSTVHNNAWRDGICGWGSVGFRLPEGRKYVCSWHAFALSSFTLY